ncbi:hypothetical protein THI4931_20970 [Pandoraea sputorum]|nr:hypothetical protein THI4931_20970 [Pandoraea sputorum]
MHGPHHGRRRGLERLVGLGGGIRRRSVGRQIEFALWHESGISGISGNGIDFVAMDRLTRRVTTDTPPAWYGQVILILA